MLPIPGAISIRMERSIGADLQKLDFTISPSKPVDKVRHKNTTLHGRAQLKMDRTHKLQLRIARGNADKVAVIVTSCILHTQRSAAVNNATIA